MNRLTSSNSTNAGHQTYNYDAVGNRTKRYKNGALQETNTYAPTSNKLTKINSSSITYNSNGQTRTKAGATFNYNAENRLSSHLKSGVTTSFKHNALGQRVYKRKGNDINYYFYDEAGQLIAEYAITGKIWKEYIYLHGQVIGFTRNGTLYHVHNDHLGRAERITNSSKTTVWRANNNDFDRVVTTNSIGGYNLGFPGQYYDQETGLYYNYFRDYDPSTGRYIQADPIGQWGGENIYLYTNRPSNEIDIYGLASSLSACMNPRMWGTCMEAGMMNSPRFINLKSHALKHSRLTPKKYYNQALNNIKNGKPFKFKHDGQTKQCFVKRTGKDSFTITSTSANGKVIFTHFNNATTQYLRNLGITLPKGF
ncbi:RHS repeat domain-containing protein [Kangiella sp. TOML190]|uniref:RHS repeat domain-containing protein n=1 Tax=Kangiella sp. TOML190 TaxID=2931351 RepID=UPI0025599F65|nr:RHS repeat-associated core domain-containing protein [Kangiella sp. TOML190]